MRKTAKIALGTLVVAGGALYALAKISGIDDALEFHARGAFARAFPETAAVSACKDEFRRNANDPDSVQWANTDEWVVRKAYTANDGSVGFVVSMQVRAKNGFGATILGRGQCEVSMTSLGPFVQRMTSSD